MSTTSLLVHVGNHDDFLSAHIPGAVFLDIKKLNRGIPPATGLLPPITDLQAAFGEIGYQKDLPIIAYDNKQGVQSARLMWVLEAIGHKHMSWLSGGLLAWQAEGHQVESGIVNTPITHPAFSLDASVVADESEVLSSLDKVNSVILDARSSAEYSGLKSASDRKGRIPGAIHLDWSDTIHSSEYPTLKSHDDLKAIVDAAGFTPDQTIYMHCQTHQRSAHSFVMLRSLGYRKLKGYAGAWAEWSENPDNPVLNASA